MTRFIREETRGHSPKVVEGLAGGGGLLTVARRALITDRGGEISHLWVEGGRIVDPYTRGINQVSGWVENGVVPRVALATPPGCDGRRQAEGIGPFTIGNHFDLGAGPDALDFTQPFSAAFVFAMSQIPSGSSEVIFGDSGAASPGLGYLFDVLPSGVCRFLVGSTPQTTTANFVFTTAVNILCGGWDGSVLFLQLNSGALVSSVGLASILPATSSISMLGRYDGGSPLLHGTLYEAWFSRIAPSGDLFASILNEVKGRLGVTAW